MILLGLLVLAFVSIEAFELTQIEPHSETSQPPYRLSFPHDSRRSALDCWYTAGSVVYFRPLRLGQDIPTKVILVHLARTMEFHRCVGEWYDEHLGSTRTRHMNRDQRIGCGSFLCSAGQPCYEDGTFFLFVFDCFSRVYVVSRRRQSGSGVANHGCSVVRDSVYWFRWLGCTALERLAPLHRLGAA